MSSSPSDPSSGSLSQTPLNALHHELSARMVPFAGYEMPVHYEEGIIFEHNFTRTASGLFDVSHMGQYYLSGPDHETVAAALERFVPGEVKALGRGRMRYSVLLNESGGIIDDLMITRPADEADDGKLELVVNAARKDVDIAYLKDRLPKGIDVVSSARTGLLALQGPKAASVLRQWCPGVEVQNFMSVTAATFDGRDCRISRAGYTGEDGFEISAEADAAEAIARSLIGHDDVTCLSVLGRGTVCALRRASVSTVMILTRIRHPWKLTLPGSSANAGGRKRTSWVLIEFSMNLKAGRNENVSVSFLKAGPLPGKVRNSCLPMASRKSEKLPAAVIPLRQNSPLPWAMLKAAMPTPRKLSR